MEMRRRQCKSPCEHRSLRPPSARELQASLPRPAIESRYSMLAQLVAFTLHAMDRAQRLEPRPPPRDTTRMVATWVTQHSPIQQVSWPQGQVQPGPVTRSRVTSANQNGGCRSYQDKADLAKDPGHGVSRSTQAVFIVDRPLFRGLCATVHSASCEGAAHKLLAKVYRLPHPDEVDLMDFTEEQINEVQLESIARHEATIYGLLWAVQGACVPRLLATLSRRPDHWRVAQEPSKESCCWTSTPPLSASNISSPSLTDSPGSSKKLGTNTPAPSVEVHALLLEDVGKVLASHTLKDLQHTLATCGYTQALSGSSSKEVQDKAIGAIQAVFVHSAQQIHKCGVLHRDVAARILCLRVVDGTLQGVF
ncbi:hypothetical protein IE81DRAFT_22527 [Ceraceosorus guamensis]|uniref:Protein kinase domain-containing protein n=1 Tax=Ceraceosorus guamensis TaxID=1522189 RepID=A0A316VQE9_9BASI|nr:hypothetical protein IE81DRAFT_22527 [Ceraceosorus guamensis]PWN39550.1 hypothetical protein IE81DRAFT_22527 [Ceraceosorus guamensis]